MYCVVQVFVMEVCNPLSGETSSYKLEDVLVRSNNVYPSAFQRVNFLVALCAYTDRTQMLEVLTCQLGHKRANYLVSKFDCDLLSMSNMEVVTLLGCLEMNGRSELLASLCIRHASIYRIHSLVNETIPMTLSKTDCASLWNHSSIKLIIVFCILIGIDKAEWMINQLFGTLTRTESLRFKDLVESVGKQKFSSNGGNAHLDVLCSIVSGFASALGFD